MCGIAGAITRERISHRKIQDTQKLMCRRGPDSQKFIERKLKNGNWLTLVFSRLSIVDLGEQSMQPVRDKSGNLLIFNGEIYNYRELRKSLRRLGCAFKTEGDAEVLSALLGTFGISGLSKVDGMYALAYFDSLKEELFLSRDFFGEKPLVVLKDASGLFFGSQISFLNSLSGFSSSVNFQKCREYLLVGYKSLNLNESTFFEGIQNLKPGYVHRINSDTFSLFEWSLLPRVPNVEPFEGTFDDAVSLTRSNLINTLENRMNSDVPITFCLSGGIDSSILVAIARRIFNKEISTYTLANLDKKYDESDQVNQICHSLALEPNFVFPTSNQFVARMIDLVTNHSAPVATVSYYIHSFLSEQISKDGYRVAIMGTGADELFTGYYDHFISYFASLVSSKENSQLDKAIADWRNTAGRYVRNPTFSDPFSYVKQSRNLSHFNDGLPFEIYLTKETLDSGSFRTLPKQYHSDLLRNQMLNELFHESVPMILNQDDLNSMRFSLENRSPYLSLDLFNLSLSMPKHYLIRDGYTKALLRHAFKDLLPPDILFSKRKVGFNANIFEFLPRKNNVIDESILDPHSVVWQFVSREKLRELLLNDDGTNSKNKFLFAALSLKFFLDVYA